MKNYFSISQTAKIVGMTTETLRHYDRIDLVKPSKTDEWTGYRYYSQQEIIKLNTIRALRCMDLTLTEIKDILAYGDLHKLLQP
jgi:MerR family transcriptional activator of bmr gene